MRRGGGRKGKERREEKENVGWGREGSEAGVKKVGRVEWKEGRGSEGGKKRKGRRWLGEETEKGGKKGRKEERERKKDILQR